MTEGSQQSLPQKIWKKLTSGRFLFVSILVHILFALIAVVLVVQVISPKRKVVFTSAPPVKEPERHEIQMAKKQKSMSAPAPVKRVLTTGLSKIALPEMPPMPAAAPSLPTSMAGMGGPGLGLGSGGMGGGSGSGGGGIPFFGVRNAQGLAGTFYDLKQTPDRKPTGIGTNPGKVPYHDTQYEEVVKHFVRGGFSPQSLEHYFQGSVPIYAQQIFVPGIKADDGPKAFGLEKDVRPSRWIVVYRGKVIAPDSGSYRFVGWADDVIVVRFNHNLVLDGSFANVSDWKRKKVYHYDFPHRGFAYAGFVVGDAVSVTKGEAYDIEVMIGESPGGDFFAQLLMEKVGEKYDKDKAGNPILPVFRVANVPTPDTSKSNGSVPTAPNGPVWTVSGDSGGLGGLLH